MAFVTKQYVRVNRTVYVPGEFLPDNIASDEELEWLIKSGAVVDMAPVKTGTAVETAEETEVSDADIDVMAGLVEEPKKKTRRKKNAD